METNYLHGKLKELIDDCIDQAAEEGANLEPSEVAKMIRVAINEIIKESNQSNGTIQVSMNGLRINLARSFNAVVRTSELIDEWKDGEIDSREQSAWHNHRGHIATFLICFDEEMEELDPDQYLVDFPEEDLDEEE